MKYRIEGTPLPVVICDLQPGETMITERGSMSWMSPNMKMETSAGGLGKALGRMFAGESLFLNRYTAQGGAGMIAFVAQGSGLSRFEKSKNTHRGPLLILNPSLQVCAANAHNGIVTQLGVLVQSYHEKVQVPTESAAPVGCN